MAAAPAFARSRPYPAVTVDPRIELLAVLDVLAAAREPLGAPKGFALDGTRYARDVKEHFWSFRSHPAVEAYGRARKAGLSAAEAEKLMLDLSAVPELRPATPALWGKQRELAAALPAFARETRFMEFFAAHQSVFGGYVESFTRDIEGGDAAAAVESYAGMTISAAYDVILCPLCRDGDMNDVRCVPGPEGFHAVTVLGPARVAGGEPDFMYARQREQIRHELLHTLLDFELERHPDAVSRTQMLARGPAARCYGNWAQCVRENIVQGAAARMTAVSTGTVEAKFARGAKEGSDPFVKEVAQKLKEYEAKRSAYPTLLAFYPELLDVFAKAAGSSLSTAAAAGYEVTPPDSCSEESAAALRPRAAPSAQEHQLKATELFLKNDLDGARRELEKARELAPEEARVELDLSVVLAAMGKDAEAMAACDEAVRLSRDGVTTAEALSSRASLWIKKKQSGKAREDLREALKAAPEDWGRRGEIAKELGELK